MGSGVLADRPGSWLRTKIVGLLVPPCRSRLRLALYPPKPKEGASS